MKDFEDVMKSVLPSQSEESNMKKIMEVVLQDVESVCERYQEVMGVELGGSVAKDTWLVDKSDIDIFVKFDKNTTAKDFVRKSLDIGFESLKEYNPYTKYSQHPYVAATTQGVVLNVVPCYDVDLGKWQSAADRSPYHTAHIKSVLSQDMKNDVRLLKKFLMLRNLYGSQIEIQGFSGYVTEVLVSYFDSFEKVLEKMSNVNKYEILGQGDGYQHTVVSIIDPIDSERDLAAAISPRNMSRFVLECWRFHNKPSPTTFYPGKYRVDHHYDNVVCVTFACKNKDIDIVWGQSKSTVKVVGRLLERNGFTVIRKGVTVDDGSVQLSFLLASLIIPRMFVKKGPNALRQSNAYRFIQTNHDTMVWVDEHGAMCCLVSREHTDADSLLEYVFSNPTRTGIAQGLHADILKGYTIQSGSQMSPKQVQNAKFLMLSDV